MTKPAPWTLSPQLTDAPELWRGCFFCVPMWEGTGRPRDLFGHEIVGEASSSVVPWVIGQGGLATNYQQITSPSSNLNTPDAPEFSLLKSGVQATWLMTFLTRNNSDTWILFGKRNEWALQSFGSDIRLATFGGNSGSGDTISKNFVYTIVIVNTAGVGGKIYLNGSLYKSFSNSDTSSDDTDPVRIGAFNANDFLFDGEVYQCSLWNRRLNDDVAQRLSADPYAMIRPRGL